MMVLQMVEEKVVEWSKHELVTTISQEQLGLSAGRMAALEKSAKVNGLQ